MKRKQRYFVALGAIPIIILLFVMSVLLYDGTSHSETDQLNAELIFVSTVDQTVEAEKKIILELTIQPDIAQSVTPYYIEILYDEALQYNKVAPTINPLQPTPECWLVADYWQLKNVADDINQTLEQDGFQTTAEVFVSVVWNVHECDSYVPVSNRVRVWIEGDTMLAPEAFRTILTQIADVMKDESNSENMTLARSNIEIAVYFVSSDGNIDLYTNLAELDALLRENIPSSELLDMLRIQ
ncbi:MAG: hypothetical protein H6672_01930 [Anaerolineaceae bacterium]|nr:hypothetical protein [Anaerolineaceae bacterium]